MIYILDKARILCRSTFRKNIIFGLIDKKLTVRNFKSYPYFKKNTWSEAKYKIKDNVSDDYNLVYNELTAINRFNAIGHYIGCIGVALNLFTLGYFIYKKKPGKSFEGLASDEYEVKPLTFVQQGFMLFASTFMSVMLVVGTRMLPFRIYHNPKEKMFKAVFLREIFRKKRVETFSEGTIKPIFKLKTEGKVFFNMNGRIVLLDPEFFPVPLVYEQMLRKTE